VEGFSQTASQECGALTVKPIQSAADGSHRLFVVPVLQFAARGVRRRERRYQDQRGAAAAGVFRSHPTLAQSSETHHPARLTTACPDWPAGALRSPIRRRHVQLLQPQ
jgi:hypothetical protein